MLDERQWWTANHRSSNKDIITISLKSQPWYVLISPLFFVAFEKIESCLIKWFSFVFPCLPFVVVYKIALNIVQKTETVLVAGTRTANYRRQVQRRW